MNKREKQDSNSRDKKVKRVKTHHARPNILSLASINIDSYVLESLEECKNCHVLYSETCKKINELIYQIYIGRKEKMSEADLEERIFQVCMLILKLKKLNRLDKHQWKKSRDAVNEMKQRVEGLNLQYQNLLYEATHLQKEVTKCLEFKSKDEEIELVPVDVFYKEAPSNISLPEITKNDEHELTMARLHWEYEQRKRLALQLKQAEISRGEYIQKIKQIKESLCSIHPILQSILEATEPLQTRFCMSMIASLAIHKTAKFLPDPLYVLYVEAYAYKETDKNIQISIEGNVDEATVLHTKSEVLSEDSGESDQEENTDLKRHRHSLSSRKERNNKDIFEKHPMSVVITIQIKDNKITLEFFYLFHLSIVTVCIKNINPEPMSSEVIGDLLNLDYFLNCLFPNDTGKETPNPANIYLLRNLSCEDSHFSNATTGWPYKWIQKLAGLEFLPISKTKTAIGYKTASKINILFMEDVIKAICSRLVARNQLYHQICSLEQGTNVPPEFASSYPSNIVSQLKKWAPLPNKEITHHPNYQVLKDLNIISEDVMVFLAEIQRGCATLVVHIILPPDYPNRTPICLLHLHWRGYHTSITTNALRELEEEVNIHFIETLDSSYNKNILICQIYHLIVCFDIYLEIECSADFFEGPKEFIKEKVVAKSLRGRSRSRPYKCIANQEIFTFR